LLYFSASHPEKISSTMDHFTYLIEHSLTSNQLAEFARYLLTSSSVPLIVGRQALEYFVLFLCGGSGVDLSLIRPASSNSSNRPTETEAEQANPGPEKYLDAQELEWFNKGAAAFAQQEEQGEETRESVVRTLIGQTSELLQPGGWGEDQVSHLVILLL
jgi:hypothetical protein